MKTKDRIAQVRASQTPEIQEFVQKLDSASTRKEVYDLEHRIYDIPGIREMNHGESWETFGSTLNDMCYAKEREINKAEKEAKAAVRAAKKQEKEAVKQKTIAKANTYMELPVLKAALDQSTTGFYNNVVKWVSESLFRNLKDIFDEAGNVILVNPGYKDKSAYSRYQYLCQIMYRYIGQDRKRLPDYEQKVMDYAHKTAKAEVDSFKYKMALKLGAVIDKKGGAEIDVQGSTVDNNSMYFTFPDGSSFEIRTQQVISVSVLGRLFARYPSTFHRVVDHNGQKMTSPSAQKMQEEFGNMENEDE